MSDDAGPKTAPLSLTLALDFDLVVAFRPEAALRGTKVPRLVADLLRTIAQERLTAAVLDDGVSVPGPRPYRRRNAT
jgi:hypothetical protein